MDALMYVIIILGLLEPCDATNTFIDAQLWQAWQNEAKCYVI